ncbi:MAG: hypothetical protein IH874_03465 [Candidatus Dadabacteria bacterium]|nr:hypothetical protein [Candidatus Dadabacteria bacterium]
MKSNFPALFVSFFLLAAVYEGDALSQEQTILPRTTGVFGNIYTVFQANSPIKRTDGSTKKLYPFYQYLELSAVSPENNLSLNTFLRSRQVLDGEDTTFDVYNAYLEYSNTAKGFALRIGRQVLTEGNNFLLLDGGMLRFTPLAGLEVVAYGGYQDKDAQPDPEKPQRSFGSYGVVLKSREFLDSIISLGYEAFDPEDASARQFLNFAFNRVVPFTDFADVYSRAEFDLKEGSFALFTVGVGISPVNSLYLNFEYSTYEPDDDRDEFLQDRIFDIFSVSRLHEARVGLTYYPTSFLEVSSSYSFARYEVLEGVSTSGHIFKLGLSWDFWTEIGLKTFQGFYFVDGREDDRAIGFNFGVSEEILRGLDLQFSFAYANFETVTNKDGDAFSYIMGVQYLVIRGLVVRAEVEINTNPDFEKDVRTNLGVSYYF